MIDPEYVTTAAGFASVIDHLRDEPRYAVDTEFHRERTYYPKVALVQIAWPGHIALVDPLAVDLAPFAEILDGDGLAVLHASTQDLEVMDLACGTAPKRLFDTQVAAGFIGMSSPSLAALTEKLLKIRLVKDDRLTDWLQRPLRAEQLSYAASDVAHLLEIHDLLVSRLGGRGRLGWAQDECDEVLRKGRPNRDPAESWRRIKEIRQLKGRAATVARALAAWRERRAAAIDQPVRFVLPDLALVAVAQRAPSTLAELRAVRGVDDRHLGGGIGTELLAVVADAENLAPRTAPAGPPPEVPRDLRPAVALVSAWIGQVATDEDLDPALLGTRADIEALLRGDDGRLSQGWRAEAVGAPIARLLAGEVAIAFDRGRGLVLEPRSQGE